MSTLPRLVWLALSEVRYLGLGFGLLYLVDGKLLVGQAQAALLGVDLVSAVQARRDAQPQLVAAPLAAAAASQTISLMMPVLRAYMVLGFAKKAAGWFQNKATAIHKETLDAARLGPPVVLASWGFGFITARGGRCR